MKKHAICGFLVEEHLQFNEYFLMHIQEQILPLLYSGLQSNTKSSRNLVLFPYNEEEKTRVVRTVMLNDVTLGGTP